MKKFWRKLIGWIQDKRYGESASFFVIKDEDFVEFEYWRWK